MKLFRFCLFIITVFCFASIAQAQPTVETNPVKDWLMDYWFVLLTAVYELLVRLFPTGRTYSIIAAVYKFIGFIVPDKAVNGGAHKIQ